MKTFTIGDALSNGWRITKANFLFLAGIVVVLFGIQFGLTSLSEYLAQDSQVLKVVISIITIFIQVLLNVGVIAIVLKLVDGQRPAFKELFTTIKPYLQFILVTILISVIVGLGLILLIVPGIVLAIGLQYATYLVVDKNMKAIEAIKRSWEMTKGVKWKLFGFALLVWVINVVGLTLFGIGMLVTVPLTMVAMAYVYRALDDQMNDNIVVAPPTSPVASTPIS